MTETTERKSLYSMVQQMNWIIDERTDDDTGEMLEGWANVLDSLEGEIREKIDATAGYLTDQKHLIESRKAHIRQLQESNKHSENRRQGLLLYLRNMMIELGLKRVEGVYTTSLRKGSERCEIVDETTIPAHFREAQPDKILKSEIKAALKSGQDVSGAEIIRGDSSVMIR